MRSFGIVEESPLLDQHLGLPQSVEDFSVQTLIPEFALKAFAIIVFPGVIGFNVECLRIDPA